MEKIKFNVWGREFELEIVWDCFPGEQITEIQKQAHANFMQNSEKFFSDSFEAIKKYCLREYTNEVGEFDNIFKFVLPVAVLIKRSVTQKRVVGLLCNFRFDIEHGLAVKFVDESVDEVGSQDIIL